MTTPTIGPVLAVHGLTRRFGHLTALSNVDLAVAAGSRHALIGPNGAGKTTLLHLIAGTLHPSSGRITFHDRDITRLPAHRRARLGIGRAFQTPAALTTLSVADNLIAGAWPHTRHPHRPGRRYRALAERTTALLDAIGLADHAQRSAADLSHGQRRLLDIAVALAAQPTLLLLDEPAAGLAGDDIHRLATAIRCLPSGTTVIMVEHHLDLVGQLCDTVTTLIDGHHHATSATTSDVVGG
jgi:branched-chain amino acid transport system ATP-binding protein